MLAVRAMAGETAWLDGRPRWHDGRVAWEVEGKLVAPNPADLALAQRRLNQISGHRRAAERSLGDLDTWLGRRRERLELAKRLHVLRGDDLPLLAERARSGEPVAIRALGGLVVAESLCSNDLPISPSATLAACGPAADATLLELVEDVTAPDQARAGCAGARSCAARGASVRCEPGCAVGYRPGLVSPCLRLGPGTWLPRRAAPGGDGAPITRRSPACRTGAGGAGLR
jgi:hypothetical protein